MLAPRLACALFGAACFLVSAKAGAAEAETAESGTVWTSRFDWEQVPTPPPAKSASVERMREILRVLPGAQKVDMRAGNSGTPILLAEINGWAVILSIDTGASSIALDGWKAVRMGLTKGEHPGTPFVKSEVRVGNGVALPPAEIYFLRPWTKPPGEIYRTSLLGWPSLRDAGAILELKRVEMWICPQDPLAPGRALAKDEWARWYQVLPLVRHLEQDRRPFVRVKVNDVDGYMLLDTGAQETLLSRQACERLGIPLMRKEGPPFFSYAGEPRELWTGPVRSFQLGGRRFPGREATAFDMDYSLPKSLEAKLGLGTYLGLLGLDLLWACEAVVDCAGDQLFLLRNQSAVERRPGKGD